MGESLPLITMVKSKQISEDPDNLSQKSKDLLATLTGLCSFYSIEDFVSFLFSQGFKDLNDYGEPWITFEVGLYQDHTKTIQLIATRNEFSLVSSDVVLWENGILETEDRDIISKELNNWCALVFNPDSRYQ